MSFHNLFAHWSNKASFGEYYGDVDDLLIDGHYRVAANVNLPIGAHYGQIIVARGLQSDTVMQIAAGGANATTQAIMFRTGIFTGGVVKWQPWAHIATAEPPQEFNLPMASGIKAIVVTTYSKDQFGRVHISAYVEKTDDTTLAASFTVATLPLGYRPRYRIYGIGFAHGNGDVIPVDVAVEVDGTLTVHIYRASSAVYANIKVHFLT